MKKLLIVTMGVVIMLGLLSAAAPVAAQTAEGQTLDWPSEARYVSVMFPVQPATSQTLERIALNWPSEARFGSTVAVAPSK